MILRPIACVLAIALAMAACADEDTVGPAANRTWRSRPAVGSPESTRADVPSLSSHSEKLKTKELRQR